MRHIRGEVPILVGVGVASVAMAVLGPRAIVGTFLPDGKASSTPPVTAAREQGPPSTLPNPCITIEFRLGDTVWSIAHQMDRGNEVLGERWQQRLIADLGELGITDLNAIRVGTEVVDCSGPPIE